MCGEHRLALVEFPETQITGHQQYSELIGMGEARANVEPGIGCLACGADWPSLAAFRKAQRERGPSS